MLNNTRPTAVDTCMRMSLSPQVRDFIWCTSNTAVTAVMRPINIAARLYAEEHCLPNRYNPSDHLPLGAVLKPLEITTNSKI